MAECIGVPASDVDLLGGIQLRVAPEADAGDAANERHVGTHDVGNTQVRDLSRRACAPVQRTRKRDRHGHTPLRTAVR